MEQTTGARVNVIAERPPTKGVIEEEKDGVVRIQGYRENVEDAGLAVRKILAHTAPIMTEAVCIPKSAIGPIIGKMTFLIYSSCL